MLKKLIIGVTPQYIPVFVFIYTFSGVYSLLIAVSVDLRKIGAANQAIIVDKTPPIAGQVFDGPLQGQDLQYTKDYQTVSINILQFTCACR